MIIFELFPYIAIALLLIITSIIKKYYRLSVIILFIFSAIRYEIGSDYKIYYSILETHNKFQIERMELLNRVIVKITYFFESYELFFLTYSIIVLLLIGMSLKLLSKDKWMAIAIFYLEPTLYLTTFGSVRQAAANTIALYSFYFLIKQRLFYFFLLNIIAILFHKSAIFMVVIFLIKKFKIYRIKKIYIISFICIVFFKKIILTYFSTILGYSNYLDSTNTTGHKIGILIILYSIFCFLIKGKIKDENDKFICYLVYLGGIIYYILVDTRAAGRVARYLLYFVPILISNFQYYIKNKNNRKIYKIAVYCYFFMFLISFLLISKNGENGGTFLPYKTLIFRERYKN
ncbi:MAG: EpsG family protein [Fusobacteriaceae bacterium]